MVKNCIIDRIPTNFFSKHRPCTRSCWLSSVATRHQHSQRALQSRVSCGRARCYGCESTKDNFPGPHRPAFCTRTTCSAEVSVIPGVSFTTSLPGPYLIRLIPFPEQRRQAIAFKNRQPFVQSDQILEHSCDVPKATTSYSINRNWTTNKAIITLNSIKSPTL